MEVPYMGVGWPAMIYGVYWDIPTPPMFQQDIPVDTPPKTDMTMENPPFEDVFPIEHGEFPMSC